MRKHFLILMLMALLPFTAWAAAPISQATVAVGNIEYGQAGAPNITVAIPNVGVLTVNVDYTVDGYFTKSGDVYTPVALSALPVNQTAYVKVSGIGSYEGVAYGEFHVSKAKVILSIKDANYFTKVFQGTDPAIVANDVQCTVHGEVYDNTTNAKKATLFLNISSTDLGYVYGSSQNVTTDGYDITFTGITLKDANNYELDVTTNARKMYITPAVIVSGGLFAFTPATAVAENTYTYNGLAAGQAPAYGITWNHDNNTQTAAITLNEGTDFEVKYYGEGDAVGSTHKPVNADTYTVKVFGKGNYTTAYDNAGLQLDNFGFKINKKSLTVMSIAQKKKYDGELFDLSTSKWNIVGRVGDDVNKKVEGLRAEFKATTQVANFAKDVNEYLIEPKYEQINGSVLNFTSYSAQTGGDQWGTGTVEVLSLDAEYATVEVKTNSVDGFVGNQYKVAVAGNERKELLDATTGASLTTPIWVVVTITDPVVARIPAATIGGLELAKNYEITTMNVNWKIEKRSLTITVPGVTMKKGDANFPALVVDPTAQTPVPLKVQPAAASGETGVLAGEADGVIAAYKVAYDKGENGVLWVPATSTVAAHAMTAAEVQIPGYANAIIANKITYQSGNQNADYYDADADNKNAANTALLANYDIQWSKGTLTVNGADFTIMPVVESTIEYGGDYDISFFAYNPLTSEEVNVPVGAVAYQINGADYTELPTEIGNYTVTIKENAAMGTGDYAGGVITREVGSFSIVKRHLTLTVKNVKLHKNDPKAILASKADFEISDEDEAVLDKMGEEITLVYSFDTDKVDIDATTNKIKGFKENQDGTNAILAVLALGGDNDHYDIEGYVKGNLTFFDANTLAIVAETDNAKIQEAANNGSEDYTVSLEFERTLAANKWNVMVLPFAVTPYEFTQTIKGYAIFDVLTSVDKENRTFKFTLALDEIPANTPFLVKPLNEVKFKTVTAAVAPATEPTISYLTFNNRKIEYKEHPGIEVGTTGVKFIGTYKTIEVDYSANPGQFMYMGSNYEFVTCENRTKALNIASTRAYLDYTGSGVVGARILVEEADGSTTAISSINADGVAVPADGWYTLNGIKLQSAPVEKGVYINNGKKVVIK